MKKMMIAAMAGALMLAGCAEKPKVLRLYTWLEYTSPDVIAMFEEKYDCTIEVTLFDNNEEMISKLREDGCGGYDIIVPSTYVIQQMSKEGMIVPIDHKRCPSVKKNFHPGFARVIEEDPEMQYGVPYATSGTGLFCATNCIPRGVDFASWAVFGNPAFTGRISLLNDMREVIGAALMYQGHSLNSTNEAEIIAAGEQIKQWIPNVHHWDCEDYKFEVPAERIWVGQGYDQCAVQAIFGDGEIPPQRNVAFVYPKEGYSFSCTELVISSGCWNDDLAYAFIEFLYSDPNVAKLNMEYITSAMPVAPAIEALDPEFKKFLIPSSEVLNKGQLLLGFPDRPDIQSLYERVWDMIIRER